MKKLIPILLAVFALASCEKDPDMGKLDDNYLVYTNYDKKADFKVPTFYLAPQILVISDSKEPEYLEGEGAEQILAAYTDNMVARGYEAAADQESADLGIQVSYIASTYYFTSYTQPEWWWGYPGYWGPGYWGGNWGGGWYYPYAVTYSYSTNSFLTEMVNLKAEQGDSKKLPVVWTLKSATKLFSVLLASKRPLITELADKLRLKYPLLPTISPCPTMRLEAIRSIIPISCRRYPKSV